MIYDSSTIGLTPRWDIALLRLSTEATLNNYVQLAALPPSGQVLPHDNFCYITGWGRTQSQYKPTYRIKDVFSAKHSQQSCYHEMYMMCFSCPPQPEVSCLPL